MEAGRELDALVAEKVMGFHKHHIHGYLHNAPSDEVWDAADLASFEYDYFWPGEEPHYSTHIADAWEVVNHLMCLGYDDKWFFQLHYDNVELWDASFYKESTGDGGGPEVWGTADTPALAICLAALKAKGVTHE